jgi:hypothetical protein
MPKPQPKPRDRHRILASLPSSTHRRLLSRLEAVPFPRSRALQEPCKPVSHAYFPRNGNLARFVRLRDSESLTKA